MWAKGGWGGDWLSAFDSKAKRAKIPRRYRRLRRRVLAISDYFEASHGRFCRGKTLVPPVAGVCALVCRATGASCRTQLDATTRKLYRRRRFWLPIAIAVAAVPHHRGLREKRQLRWLTVCAATPSLARRHHVHLAPRILYPAYLTPELP